MLKGRRWKIVKTEKMFLDELTGIISCLDEIACEWRIIRNLVIKKQLSPIKILKKGLQIL